MSEATESNVKREGITLDEAPGKKFYVDSIEFKRSSDAQKLSVEVEHSNGIAIANVQTENTEDLERLVLQYMEKARSIQADLRLNFAEIVWESDEDLSLVVSIKLPPDVGIMSDQGFKLQELAQVISDTSGNAISAEYTEFRRGNIIPLKIPREFQSDTFEFHQKMMWARMASDGFEQALRNQHFEQRVKIRPQLVGEKKVSILRQIVWRIDTPKTREYSAIVIITIVTYVACLILCTWIESLKR